MILSSCFVFYIDMFIHFTFKWGRGINISNLISEGLEMGRGVLKEILKNSN